MRIDFDQMHIRVEEFVLCLASIPCVLPPFSLLSPKEAVVAMAERSDLVLLPSIRRPDEDEVRGIGGLKEPYSLDTDLMVPWRPVLRETPTKKKARNIGVARFIFGVTLMI